MGIDFSILSTAFLEIHGETVRYRATPAGADSSLQAVVDRERWRPIDESGATIAAYVPVIVDLADIDASTIRAGVSQVQLALLLGGTPEWRTIRGVSYHDAGMVYLEVG